MPLEAVCASIPERPRATPFHAGWTPVVATLPTCPHRSLPHVILATVFLLIWPAEVPPPPHGMQDPAVAAAQGGALHLTAALPLLLQEADAVLTTRERLKGGGDALVTGARAAGLPVFSMRSGTSASIIKALRSLAGIDPSPLSLRDASAAVRAAPPFAHRSNTPPCTSRGSAHPACVPPCPQEGAAFLRRLPCHRQGLPQPLQTDTHKCSLGAPSGDDAAMMDALEKELL